MPRETHTLVLSILVSASLATSAAHAQTPRASSRSARPSATPAPAARGGTSGHTTAASSATSGHATASSSATSGHPAATSSATSGHTTASSSATAHPSATATASTGHAAAGHRPALYHGTYQVTSSTTVQITAPLPQTETRSTRETVQVTPGSDADLVFDVNGDNGDRCVLNANRNADGSIAFLPGQTCNVTDDQRGIVLQVTVADGTGSVRGDNLSLRIHWNVSGAAFFMRIVGTGMQTSTGRRVAAQTAAVRGH